MHIKWTILLTKKAFANNPLRVPTSVHTGRQERGEGSVVAFDGTVRHARASQPGKTPCLLVTSECSKLCLLRAPTLLPLSAPGDCVLALIAIYLKENNVASECESGECEE
ncbi:hypothetical protein WA026_023343 [Henosepilachna vigintioctopunctata]|uniref:Uncharacterized protein n=1 Tax=Henosepilachna vigintioctopunctata TaxID=420089 RepID=A0AAW1VIW3_9CUCU